MRRWIMSKRRSFDSILKWYCRQNRHQTVAVVLLITLTSHGERHGVLKLRQLVQACIEEKHDCAASMGLCEGNHVPHTKAALLVRCEGNTHNGPVMPKVLPCHEAIMFTSEYHERHLLQISCMAADSMSFLQVLHVFIVYTYSILSSSSLST